MFLDTKQKNIKIAHNNFKLNYGFLFIKENKSLYINLTSWVLLLDEESDINRSKLLKDIKSYLHGNLNKDVFLNDKYIVDLSFRKAGLRLQTKCYFELEIILYSKEDCFNQNTELNEDVLRLSKTVVDNILNKINGVSFHLKK